MVDPDPVIEAKRVAIKTAMRSLGRAIQSGDQRELLYWVIPGNALVGTNPFTGAVTTVIRGTINVGRMFPF